VGVSGQRSVDQPHLHFGVREAGTRSAYRDPLDLLAPPPAGRAPEPGPAPVRVTEPSAADTAPGASAAAPSPAPASPPGLPARSPLPSPAAGPGPRPVPAHNPAMPVQVTIPTLHAPRAWHAYSTAPSARGHATGPAPHASGGAGSVRASWSTPSGAAAPDPARGPGTARAATASRVLHPSQARRGRGGGIDIAWLLACLGLVATAAVLGRHGGRPRAARGRRSVVAALLGLTARGSGAR
jgi:hypothetical protein